MIITILFCALHFPKNFLWNISISGEKVFEKKTLFFHWFALSLTKKFQFYPDIGLFFYVLPKKKSIITAAALKAFRYYNYNKFLLVSFTYQHSES